MKQPEDKSRRGFLKASSMLGLAVTFGPAALGGPFAHTKSEANPKENTTTKTGASPVADSTAIRPFHSNFPETDLTDLRRRINATKWPEREPVTDASQGVQLATTQKLARYWGTDYDWRKCQAKLNAAAAIRHRDRWARHSFYPCAFEAAQCTSHHHHARMARLDHRADEGHRSADQSNGTWRELLRTLSTW